MACFACLLHSGTEVQLTLGAAVKLGSDPSIVHAGPLEIRSSGARGPREYRSRSMEQRDELRALSIRHREREQVVGPGSFRLVPLWPGLSPRSTSRRALPVAQDVAHLGPQMVN